MSKKFFLNKKRYLCKPKGVYSGDEAVRLVANLVISVTAWNKISKREIWDNLRFPENHVYEDLYIIFQMISKVKKIYLENEPLILYRVRPGSINDNNSIKNINDLLESWSVFENFIEKKHHEIFDDAELIKAIEKILIYFLFRYARTLSMHFPNKSEIIDKLKEKIIQLEKIVKIENCSAEIRLVYYMIFNHPLLLSKFYMPCHVIYKVVKGVVRVINK